MTAELYLAGSAAETVAVAGGLEQNLTAAARNETGGSNWDSSGEPSSVMFLGDGSGMALVAYVPREAETSLLYGERKNTVGPRIETEHRYVCVVEIKNCVLLPIYCTGKYAGTTFVHTCKKAGPLLYVVVVCVLPLPFLAWTKATASGAHFSVRPFYPFLFCFAVRGQSTWTGCRC